MAGHQTRDGKLWFKSELFHLGLTLLGIAAFVALGAELKSALGIPFKTTYRVACAAACLVFIYKLGRDYPSETWPRTSLWVALLINIAIFFTPLVDRPASRGELMLFALPDAVVTLVTLLATYRVANVHQRAMRQQMSLGLIIAIAACATLFTLVLMDPHTGQSWGLS